MFALDTEIDEQVATLTRMLSSNSWECCNCCKKATQRTDLKKHIEAAHLNLYLPCHHCGEAFKARHLLLKHMRTFHGIFNK